MQQYIVCKHTYTHTYSGQIIPILSDNPNPFLLAPIRVDLELDQGVQGDTSERERHHK